ncbi:MAG: type IV pilin N-terminal domain-containing protein [Methanoregulaceae archaeon]
MPAREPAVSSVVGVMLMLSVTILIAALVSTLAGGFSGNTGSSDVPQSTLGIRVSLYPYDANNPAPNNITYFDHRGGDPFSITGIRVVFQSQTNKTSLSASDVSDTCVNFSVVGDSSATTVRAGDAIRIAGTYSGNATRQGIRFGNVIFWKDEEVSWMVIDKASGTTIATGSLFL